MTAARKDFIIEKGARFYKELQLVTEAGVPVSTVGKKVRCIIQESWNTDVITYDMTEDNARVQVITDSLGNVALYLTAEETLAIVEMTGVYKVQLIDEAFEDEEIEWLLQGKIEYRI